MSRAKRNAPDRDPGRRAGDAITGGVDGHVTERSSFDLRNVAHAAFTIGTANLHHAQFPDTVVTPNGVDLHRPPTWR